MNIIYRKPFKDFINSNFSGYNHAVICGKGPTYKQIEIFEPNTLYISVNDVFNVAEHTDIMVANDIEMFDRTDKDKLKHLKNLLVPFSIHQKEKPKKGFTYKNLVEKIKDDFFGNLIVFNFDRGKWKSSEFITLQSMCSSSNSAADFVSLIPNIKSVTFYGVGKHNQNGYAKGFPATRAINSYNKKRTRQINETARQSLKGKKVEFL